MIFAVMMTTFANAQSGARKSSAKSSKIYSEDGEAKNKKGGLSCKLTTPEFRERKDTIIKSLKSQILDKKELKNGYSYKFAGSDEMVDELGEFVKTERACCNFFVFNISTSGDKSEAWLEITGPKGAKNFIKTELEM